MNRYFWSTVLLFLGAFVASAQDGGDEVEVVHPEVPDNPIIYPDNPSWNRTKMAVICTSFVFAPMVFCDPTMPPETYSGLQIDLFKATAAELGWELGRDYTFYCGDWIPLQDELVSPNGTCYSLATGLDIQTFHTDRGIKFGYTYYQAGYKIMIANTKPKNDPWAFLRAFSWQVWVLLLCTALIVPTAAWFLEGMIWGPQRALDNHHQSYRYLRGLGNMLWHYSCMIVSFEPLDFRAWPSRFLALAYGFLLTVVIALYTANTAAMLQIANANSQIKGINDLAGKAVGTIDQYVDLINGYGVRAAPFVWSSAEDEIKFKQDLIDGVYTAIIVDAVWVDYTAATDAECRFRSVGPGIKLNNYAVAYPYNFPDEEIQKWDDAMLKVQEETDLITKLNELYINAPSNCTFSKTAVPPVNINDVAGLWYLLAGAIGIGLLWMIIGLFDPQRRREAANELYNSFHHIDLKKSVTILNRKSAETAANEIDPPMVDVIEGPTQDEIRRDVTRIRERLATLERQLAGSNTDFHKPFQVVQ